MLLCPSSLTTRHSSSKSIGMGSGGFCQFRLPFVPLFGELLRFCPALGMGMCGGMPIGGGMPIMPMCGGMPIRGRIICGAPIIGGIPIMGGIPWDTWPAISCEYLQRSPRLQSPRLKSPHISLPVRSKDAAITAAPSGAARKDSSRLGVSTEGASMAGLKSCENLQIKPRLHSPRLKSLQKSLPPLLLLLCLRGAR